MKKLLSLLLVVTMVLSLAGCGSTTTEPEATTSTDAASNSSTETTTQLATGDTTEEKEPVTIRFSWWGGDSRHEATLAMIDAFMAKYPHITVEAEYAGWQGFFDKQATQIVGGTEADVCQINYSWAYVFSPDGETFMDLNAVDTLEVSNWPQSTLDPFTIEGKLQAVPASLGGRQFYLNKATYDKAGIEKLPETWDELIAAGKQMKETLGDNYFALGAVDFDDEAVIIMMTYLTQKYGKPMIENDKLAYSEEEILEGFYFLKDLLDNNVLASLNYDSDERNQENVRWINGEYAGCYQWNSSVKKFADTLDPTLNPEVVLAPAPYFGMEGQVHSGSYNKLTMGFAISKNSDHPEEAGLLLNFMYTDPTAVEILGMSRAVPVNQVAHDMLKEADAFSGLQYEGHLVVQNSDDSYALHPYYEDNTLREAYNAPMTEFMYGNLITPEEAAKAFVEAFDTTLPEVMEK